ncbi:MAG: sugar ABC transporter ATP-binding protein [Anaerolineaceae bacterium]|nr:sugar ABC transporter ATP-binding protein [Anaerolineaceae bacterium]
MEKELLFKTNGIGKIYGSNTVLQGINVEFHRGEIVGLIGENGAGKSTLMKIIAGVENPSMGTMEMNGKPFKASSMLDANKHGIGMVFQEQSLISNLSAAQNIFLGREKDFSTLGLVNWAKMNAAARKSLDKLGLTNISPSQKISDMPFAMRQMVEITKVLDIVSETANDRALILLDEPTTVLTDDEMKILFEQVRLMKEKGNCVIFISHRLQEVLDLTDRIYVFKDGHLTGEVETKDADEYKLYEMMVGRETNGEYYVSQRQTIPTDEVVLEVENLAMFGSFKNVSFKLHKGEVLGLYGVEGSGKEDVCAVISGDEAKTDGTIKVNGKEVKFGSPSDARRNGILSVPRDRRDEGIIGLLPISENISVSNYGKNATAGLISGKKQTENAKGWIKDLGIKCEGPNQRISNLSGGNAQKVIFARVLDSECPILILDHPTRGVDIGAKGDIYSLIRDITGKGFSVLLMGDTLDECLGLSSRIIVMKDGLVTAEFDCPANNKPDQVEVVQKML